MVTTSRVAVQPFPGWPPDDTEESVAGTNRHQMAMLNMRRGINEVAHALVGPGEPPSFQALSQTMIRG